MGGASAANPTAPQTARRQRQTPTGRPGGALEILRTGAPWKDLPERYPPYQTCHRRFQEWVRSGVMERILRALAEDLRERGGLDLTECFIDGTFVLAKKGGTGVGKTKRGRVRRSWQWQKLRELGVEVPMEFALLPPILLDKISTDWVLGPGNDLLTHYTDFSGLEGKYNEIRAT